MGEAVGRGAAVSSECRVDADRPYSPLFWSLSSSPWKIAWAPSSSLPASRIIRESSGVKNEGPCSQNTSMKSIGSDTSPLSTSFASAGSCVVTTSRATSSEVRPAGTA